jgi:hypothetical protein
MSDFTRFVTAKLSGEWSAASVAGVLTDIIIEARRRRRLLSLSACDG